MYCVITALSKTNSLLPQKLPAEDRTFASILEQVGIFEREVLPIQPHSRLKYYTVGMHKEEESRVDLQVRTLRYS